MKRTICFLEITKVKCPKTRMAVWIKTNPGGSVVTRSTSQRLELPDDTDDTDDTVSNPAISQ